MIINVVCRFYVDARQYLRVDVALARARQPLRGPASSLKCSAPSVQGRHTLWILPTLACVRLRGSCFLRTQRCMYICVCMCVCMYVCMCVCIYVCICVCVYVCVYVCVFSFFTKIDVYVYTYVLQNTYLDTSAYMYLFIQKLYL